jgi:hypothetical protein
MTVLCVPSSLDSGQGAGIEGFTPPFDGCNPPVRAKLIITFETDRNTPTVELLLGGFMSLYHEPLLGVKRCV